MSSSLSTALKDEIQGAYRAWLAARSFASRRGQREMIAAVARTLAGDGERHLLVEAGTGTGKTASYLLAAVPIARSLGKQVVLSTATVALQEQVVLRDLPDLVRHSGLAFSFCVAKGRRRYVCPKRLDDALGEGGGGQSGLDFGMGIDPDVQEVFANLRQKFDAGLWNGEIDAWPGAISDLAWQGATTDHRACANRRCPHFKRCPFFLARREIDDADVIVANHDLVLADLALGGGAVLPEPEATVYIFDEAHHLPGKAQGHSTLRARVLGTAQWLDQCSRTLAATVAALDHPPKMVTQVDKVENERLSLSERLGDLELVLRQLHYNERQGGIATHRFAHGTVPDAVASAAAVAAPGLATLARALDTVHRQLQEIAEEDDDGDDREEAERWMAALGPLHSRAEATYELLDDFASANAADSQARFARWSNRSDTDFELFAAPLEPGDLLHKSLWSQCYAAISTSATLTVQGHFDRYVSFAGLPADVDRLRLPSPFDYPRVATLHVPRLGADPRDADAHTAEIAERLPALLGAEDASLVLFTSWRQLNGVLEAVRDSLGDMLQVQGESSKQALIEAHTTRVDAGEPSHILGLASFAEGIDLPGKYCRHVIIAKLPFAVPDDPIAQATAEWVEDSGRNAFVEVTVPDATLKLVQACGRLIRNEHDHGRITLLDRRLVTARYGRIMLDSLPPFHREFD